jgi:hypothetical protein
MLVTLSAIALAQGATSHPRWSLVDLLVWDADLSIDIAAYPADVRAQIDALRKRSKAYKSSRPKTDDGLNGMGYGARVRYERRLVAAAGAETDALALAYVNDLRPYYEWEGGSEGPRMEAEFAAQYQAAHPAGPFSHYLPLLEAHRWLCAAEGFDYEKSSADAAKSRAAYSKALSVAQQSKSLLVRTAATELGKRNKCHVE